MLSVSCGTRFLVLMAMLASLSACGGGSMGEAPQAAAPQAAAAVAASSDPFGGFDKATVSNELFDFGEQSLPQYFPGPAATATLQPYLYRFYPATGIYLGVDQNTGHVYVMGGRFGNSPTDEGPLTNYIMPRPATSVNVANAWHNLLVGTANWQTTGIGPDGRRYDFFVSTMEGSPAAFPLTGAIGSRSLEPASISIDGTSLGTLTETLFRNGDSVFGVSHGDGSCSVVQQVTALPGGASPIGAAGSFYASDDYDSCSSAATIVGTTQNDWSLQTDSGVTLFCLASQSRDTSGQFFDAEEDCIEAGADGTLGHRARITLYLSSTISIRTRNF